MGPGRGSGAGSIAAYCVGITDIDPIRYNLIFERFLNPERVSMPDFDLDFCYERRQEVIDYVNRKYGADHVAQIVTFGTMAARNAIRDVGRVMGLPYQSVDTVAKLVPMELKMTLKRALEVSTELKKLSECFFKPVMANVSGFSVSDYAGTCERISGCKDVGWIEVNISCPNVHNGGMSFGTVPSSAAEVTRAVRRVTDKPIIMKLSPNVTDIAEIARACESEGADGISLINTLLGMRIDLKKGKPVLANKTGGYSGPSVLPVAIAMVYKVYEAVKIPVVGMGGISSAEDVLEFMYAGASAVEVGAANLIDPFACKKIIEDLPRVMEKYGINDLNNIIGGAH